MFGSWWFLWIAAMFLFLVPLIGYGWGYRGWGPPYPSYIQRRRSRLAATIDGTDAVNHLSWGLGGDFVWMVFIFGTLWMFWYAFWRR